MYNNSVIVFSTDNGGPAAGLDGNSACNYPLRGMKTTLWEGALLSGLIKLIKAVILGFTGKLVTSTNHYETILTS